MKRAYEKAVIILDIKHNGRLSDNIEHLQWTYNYLFEYYHTLYKNSEQCMVAIAIATDKHRLTIRHHLVKFADLSSYDKEYMSGYLEFKKVMDRNNFLATTDLLKLKIDDNLKNMHHLTNRLTDLMNQNEKLINKIVGDGT